MIIECLLVYAVHVCSTYDSCLFVQWAANIPVLRGPNYVPLPSQHAFLHLDDSFIVQLCNQEVFCSQRLLHLRISERKKTTYKCQDDFKRTDK